MTPVADMALTPVDALLDRRLLGAAMDEDMGSWAAWLSVLRAAYGLPLDDADRALFAEVAGGREPPAEPVRELWVVAGRRSGKSRVVAALAAFEAAFAQHSLAAGETGHVLVLAPTRKQARVVFDYATGFFEASPVLRELVEDIRAEEIVLRNRLVIGVHSANYRTLRGRTLIAVIADEMAFWRDELSASPDVEVYRSVQPALAASRGRFLAISTAYAQRGLLWQKHRDHFGQATPGALVIQAPTRTLNPTIGQDVVDAALADDAESASAEWLSEFRGDLSSYIGRDVLEQAVDGGRPEHQPVRGTRYHAFVDMSGGQRDSSALAIAHAEGAELIVLDLIREWASPHSPADAVMEMAEVLKRWRISTGLAWHQQGNRRTQIT